MVMISHYSVTVTTRKNRPVHSYSTCQSKDAFETACAELGRETSSASEKRMAVAHQRISAVPSFACHSTTRLGRQSVASLLEHPLLLGLSGPVGALKWIQSH
jgi:guanylate kinase